MGYARLLNAEIASNEPVVNELRTYGNRHLMSLTEGSYTLPTIEQWPAISVKLAPLIKPEEFALLAAYYRQLQVLVGLREKQVLAAEGGKPISDYLSEMETCTQKARSLLSKYATPRAGPTQPPTTPSEASEGAGEGAEPRRERSWWRQLFGLE